VPPSSYGAVQSRKIGHEQPVETLDQGQCRTEQQAATQIGGSTYTYMIKLINSKRKSDFTIRNWYDIGKKLDTISDLKRKLTATFSDELSAETFQLGYLEPPSQAKRWLQEQRDLDGMYTIFPPGTKITLWVGGYFRFWINPVSSSNFTVLCTVEASTFNAEATCL